MSRYNISPLDDTIGPWKFPCCVWKKQPPVGAVLGHVAERNGAVFISDPGPSMKKKSPSGKRAGDAQRGPALQAEIQDC